MEKQFRATPAPGEGNRTIGTPVQIYAPPPVRYAQGCALMVSNTRPQPQFAPLTAATASTFVPKYQQMVEHELQRKSQVCYCCMRVCICLYM